MTISDPDIVSFWLEALAKQGFVFTSVDKERVSFICGKMVCKNTCGQMKYTVFTLLLHHIKISTLSIS